MNNNTKASIFYLAAVQGFAEGMNGRSDSLTSIGKTIRELAYRFHKSPGDVSEDVAHAYMDRHGFPPVNLQQLDRSWLELTGYTVPIRPPRRR